MPTEPSRRRRGGRWLYALWTLCLLLTTAVATAQTAPASDALAPGAIASNATGTAATAQPDTASPAPRIGIATMAPGEIFFERFGHNAIVVESPEFPEPLSYNFGYFDMSEDGFVGRFVQGDMRYRLVVLPWSQDMDYYRRSGRGVRMQWLDLSDAQARALADALAVNARPENARYRYEYFTDNCATRVRDALDAALGGALAPQLRVRSQGNTYRSEAVRLASPAPWMWLGFDVGLGPAADAPMTRWDEAYVPMRLAEGLRKVRLADGRPLVRAEEELLPHRIAPEPGDLRLIWWQWLCAGLALAIAWSWLRGARPRLAAQLALTLWALCALLGSVMLALWLGTEHRFAWANQNLLLFNPLCWLLLPGGWRAQRGHPPGRLFAPVLLIVAACAVLAPPLMWMQQVPQSNAHWIALMLPLHAAFAIGWMRGQAVMSR